MSRAHRRLPELRTPVSTASVLVIFCFLLFVFPADTVILSIGAIGFPASLFALLLLGAYVVAVMLGLHHPLQYASPARGVVVLLLLATMASYVFIPHWNLSIAQRASADRFLLLILSVAAIVLCTSEGLHTMADVRRVVRAAVAGGAFSGFVALVQFFTGFDIAPLIRAAEPGFSVNGVAFGSQLRVGLVRVAGTATHPIELGVTSGMLVAPAVWLVMTDHDRKLSRRVLPLVFLLGGVTSTVSRSSIIAVVLTFGVFAVLLPAASRVWAFAAMPVVVGVVFMTIPGFVRTISEFFVAGNSDPSVANRTNNYPFVLHTLAEHPWFGTGGGTYIAPDLTKVFDNEYLTGALCLGIVGTFALLLYLVVPVVIALYARTHSTDPSMRALLAGLAGASLAATVCSATFDSFSFPVFVFVDALFLGLIGACYRIVRAELTATPARPAFVPALVPSLVGAGPRLRTIPAPRRPLIPEPVAASLPPAAEPAPRPAEPAAPAPRPAEPAARVAELPRRPTETPPVQNGIRHGNGQHPASGPPTHHGVRDHPHPHVRRRSGLFRVHPDAVRSLRLVPADEPPGDH